MFGLSQSEFFLYGGIAAMAAAAVLAVLCIILFTITGRHINQELEQDYGKRRRHTDAADNSGSL